jgi:hypothetical protein
MSPLRLAQDASGSKDANPELDPVSSAHALLIQAAGILEQANPTGNEHI